MIDLQAMQARLEKAKALGAGALTVTPAWLEQALRELSEARAAQAERGQVFNRRGPVF